MSVSRRALLGLSAAGLTTALLGCRATPPGSELNNPLRAAALDAAISRPVLRRELFPDPILIDTIELLHHAGSLLCRVRSTDGAEGLSVSNNIRMNFLYPVFERRIAPVFRGRDARDLDQLVDEAWLHDSNYKFQSYALGVPLATLEFALLDLLGRITGRPLGALLGEVVNPDVGIYLARNYRHLPARETVARLQDDIARSGYRALKFKVGEKMGSNGERISGRTDALIPLARKAFGDDMWLGVDANGGFDVPRSVAVGKQLATHGYAFFEEPVPFDWYREAKQIADQIDIPLAGGEQEGSLRNYRWMVDEGILQVIRPDMFYFGGMIRAMRVARLAAVGGYLVVPHLSGSGLGYVYLLHFVSAVTNAGPYHPNSRSHNEVIPFDCPTSSLRVEEGSVKVPTGPGLGLTLDPAFVARHERVTLL